MPKSDHSPHVLRFSLDEALTLAARIISFTNASHYGMRSAVSERQQELFFLDIVVFALHVRKIGEITDLRSSWKKLQVLPEKGAGKRGHEDPSIRFETDFWTIVDKLIHSRSLLIVQQQVVHEHSRFQQLDAVMDTRDILYRFCLVKSDRGKQLQFLIESFVLTFVEKIWLADECQALVQQAGR